MGAVLAQILLSVVALKRWYRLSTGKKLGGDSKVVVDVEVGSMFNSPTAGLMNWSLCHARQDKGRYVPLG